MRKPPGVCIFCGNVGNLTKQHVIPDRLKRILPREAQPTRTQEKVSYTDGTLRIPKDCVPDFKVKQGHLGTVRLRCVCASCNNGWMSEVEDAAFPALEALIFDRDVTLSCSEQNTVAAMIANMACTVDLLDIPHATVNQAERTHIFNYRNPPSHWGIFVGRSNSDMWTMRIHRHGFALPLEGQIHRAAECNTQFATIALNRLLIHIITSRALEIDASAIAAMHGTAAIHPARGELKWQSLPVLGERECDEVANGMYAYLARQT